MHLDCISDWDADFSYDGSGTLLEYYDYYPFGLVMRSNVAGQPTKETFTGKEQDTATGYYYFGSRYYDAALAGWGAVDPQWHQYPAWSPYAGLLDDPVGSIDPDGEFVLSLISKIIAGDIDNAGDVFRTILTGSITDPVNLAVAANPANVVSTGTSFISGLGEGIINGDWERLGNTGEIFLGQFYTDNNRSFFGEIWQGVSRSTWELPQTIAGYNYSQWRNTAGRADRVDLFGGATFVTDENNEVNNGLSLGNYININITDEIPGSFEDRMLTDPLYMHEYGHTFDSQLFGPFYLPVVGVPSAISAQNARQVPGEPRRVTTHDFRWYEMRANRHAARYFGKHYGVNWYTPWGVGTYETYYPRKRR